MQNELQSLKVEISDACIRSPFANTVTHNKITVYVVANYWPHSMMHLYVGSTHMEFVIILPQVKSCYSLTCGKFCITHEFSTVMQ